MILFLDKVRNVLVLLPFSDLSLARFSLQISSIARGQRQIMHQLDSISNLMRENLGERRSSHQVRTKRKSITSDYKPITVPLILTLAIGGIGVLLFKGFLSRN